VARAPCHDYRLLFPSYCRVRNNRANAKSRKEGRSRYSFVQPGDFEEATAMEMAYGLFRRSKGKLFTGRLLDVHTVTPPKQTLERRTPPISKYTVDTPTKDFRSAVDGLLLSFPFISSASTCFTLPCRCFPFLYPKNRSSRYPHHLPYSPPASSPTSMSSPPNLLL
jgi:hypothetical protein